MVSLNQANEARHKILRAAEAEFASKGFEGARVDAIAASAGVNKALIYYYFKNKAAILDTLLSEFFDALRAVKDEVHRPPSDLPDWDAYWDQVATAVYRYTRNRLNLLRIAVQEELKGDGGDSRIVRGWKAEWDRTNVGTPANGDLFGFFFQDLPSVLFLLLNQQWSHAMGRDPVATEEAFLELSRTITREFYKAPPRL